MHIRARVTDCTLRFGIPVNTAWCSPNRTVSFRDVRYFPAPCGIEEYSPALKPIRIGQEPGLFAFDFIIIEAAIAILTQKTKTRFVFLSFTPGGNSVYPESINRTDVSCRRPILDGELKGARRVHHVGIIFRFQCKFIDSFHNLTYLT